MNEFLTVDDIHKKTGIPKTDIYCWIKYGFLPSRKFGMQKMIELGDYETFVNKYDILSHAPSGSNGVNQVEHETD